MAMTMHDANSLENTSRAAGTNFRHVVLTRFNVRYVLDKSVPAVGVDPLWLGERFKLFERYCLPSVLAQSEQNFTWIIFFDAETPAPFRDRAQALAGMRADTHPVFCDTLPLDDVKTIVRDTATTDYRWLLTTRLDNDDGLHTEFVSTVQSAQAFSRPEVLNCPTGIILSGRRAYRQRHLSNAFMSLCEPAEEFKTVLGAPSHTRIAESYPVRQLTDRPMWLQVIHGSNISNRARGRRIPLERAIETFPAAFGAAPQPRDNPLAILIENLTLYWVRMSRDVLVASLRRVLGAFGVDLKRKPVPRRRQRAEAREHP